MPPSSARSSKGPSPSSGCFLLLSPCRLAAAAGSAINFATFSCFSSPSCSCCTCSPSGCRPGHGTHNQCAPPVSGTGILERRRRRRGQNPHTQSVPLTSSGGGPFRRSCGATSCQHGPFSPVSPSPFRSAPQQHDDLRGERIQLLHRRQRRQRRPTRRVSGSTTAGRPPGIRNLRHNKLCSSHLPPSPRKGFAILTQFSLQHVTNLPAR